MKKINLLFVLLIYLSSSIFAINTQPSEADKGMASEEFRRGVQSYYLSAYNEAIIQFEKALSYLPSEPLILEWLGRAYYMSGMESVALEQWKTACKLGYKEILLENKIEIIQNRRLHNQLFSENSRYVLSYSFEGSDEFNNFFSQPACILPLSTGEFWITAYGSNELLCMDVNGTIVNKVRGPINGFDRPMDLIQLKNGNLLLSEYAGDRISVLSSKGNYIKSFGEKGTGNGQFLGPQYLAEDSVGNIYVTDFGNKRVTVFNKENEYLFSFGNFSGPTGIAIVNDVVFVADSITGAIYSYDIYGNYLDEFVLAGSFVSPESIRQYQNYLLVSDLNKIYSVDISNGQIYESVKTGNAPSKLICAIPDSNANLLVSDFTQNEIMVMSKMNELVGGLYVQIQKVYSDKFPQVTVDVKVENRFRQKVVGMKNVNFFVSENGNPVTQMNFEGSVDENDNQNVVLIIDKKKDNQEYSVQIEKAIREIAKSMKGRGQLSVISAQNIPVLEFSGNPRNCEKFSMTKISQNYSDVVALDNAIRLAANTIINSSNQKNLFLLTDGLITEKAFTKYPLSEIAAYLANNNISLSTLLIKQQATCDEIKYLVSQVNGREIFIHQKEGLSKILYETKSLSGVYRLSYTSNLSSEYGRTYLPVEVEVYLNKRSGKDESGYFSPLK